MRAVAQRGFVTPKERADSSPRTAVRTAASDLQGRQAQEGKAVAKQRLRWQKHQRSVGHAFCWQFL